MKIGVIKELVFIRVNGFEPSTDNSILRADIKAMLPAAVNAAMDGAERINKAEGDEFPSEFFGVYRDIPINSLGSIPFITIDHGTVALKNSDSIRRVYDNCGNEYGPLGDTDMGSIKYYSDKIGCMKWYRRLRNRLELYGVPPLADKLNYDALVSVDDLSDDDEAPIQAGFEPQVIDILARWFIKDIPYDSIIDTKDINSAD